MIVLVLRCPTTQGAVSSFDMIDLGPARIASVVDGKFKSCTSFYQRLRHPGQCTAWCLKRTCTATSVTVTGITIVTIFTLIKRPVTTISTDNLTIILTAVRTSWVRFTLFDIAVGITTDCSCSASSTSSTTMLRCCTRVDRSSPVNHCSEAAWVRRNTIRTGTVWVLRKSSGTKLFITGMSHVDVDNLTV